MTPDDVQRLTDIAVVATCMGLLLIMAVVILAITVRDLHGAVMEMRRALPGAPASADQPDDLSPTGGEPFARTTVGG